MNIQALMKQAQSLQKDMMKVKEEIDKKEFTGESALVKVIATGNKKIVKIEISNKGELSSDDLEILEDMTVVAINDAFTKIDKELESKMGRFGNAIPSFF